MSSNLGFSEQAPNPITVLQYRDISNLPHMSAPQQEFVRLNQGESSTSPPEERISEVELSARIAKERAEATRETEERMIRIYEQKLAAAKAPIAAAISDFAEHRNEYYARVEAEVVQLALAIAKKILHREAQVDPMLVATLVRIAVEKLREGSSVKVRVNPARVASWKAYFAGQSATARVEICGDAELSEQDCLLETELGTAHFGLDSQLKEVEQGFFDLLALRPVSR
jgi:flagellar assembly protein FliH